MEHANMPPMARFGEPHSAMTLATLQTSTVRHHRPETRDRLLKHLADVGHARDFVRWFKTPRDFTPCDATWKSWADDPNRSSRIPTVNPWVRTSNVKLSPANPSPPKRSRSSPHQKQALASCLVD
jgi:hypothetical protein